MSEPGPESIPTSADPRSKRPVKRRAITPHSEHASQIEHLFRDPERDLKLPNPSKPRTSTSLPAPPEIVANVQGSSAGAGSGEFHVYKASRRREYERLRMMQSEVDQEKANVSWENEQDDLKRKDDEKTEKNRKKREKRNAAKKNKKQKTADDQGSEGMVVDGKKGKGPSIRGVGLPANEDQHPSTDGLEQSVETPGLIIHDD
ncbi:PRKR-interacting protein 1 [Aspergillus nanangensis]|uniref:PRKR-interacting protein 1 n=1 Tax=Aspergillus nanangensis TaxID=2582783 RepID=A0AAD4CVA3_ASPNN|nr:PRKR-interacting protein 1 [Aspergillus nanangensis]